MIGRFKPFTSSVIPADLEHLSNSEFLKEKEKFIEEEGHPTHIESDTVGSYIFGCDFDYYGDVDKNCSLLCQQARERRPCDSQVWGGRTKLNNADSHHAYLYIESEESEAYVPIELLSQMEEEGVKSLSILKTYGNLSTLAYEGKLETVPIEDEGSFFFKEENKSELENKIKREEAIEWKTILFFGFVILCILYFLLSSAF